jgi:uncharacterized protein
MNRVMGFGMLLLVLLLTVLVTGCSQSASQSFAPAMPTSAQPKLPTIKLWLGAEEMEAEMALTAEQQQTGMMFRTNRLAENAGMLFPLPVTTRAAFWMTNCPVPLAAAYISPDGTIQEIHAFHANDARPVAAAAESIRFVLETSEGWFERHHISTGTVIRTEHGPLMSTFFPAAR